MSASKNTFTIADPFDAKSLARMFERITGKRPSDAEIEEVQKQLDEGSRRSMRYSRTADPSLRWKH